MRILVVNCGSSSVKYQLFDIKSYSSLARGIVERIGTREALLKHSPNGAGHFQMKVACRDHYVALQIIVDMLTDATHGVIASRRQIDGVGHRVVHGGEEFSASTIITKDVIASIERYSELAPLHNPPSLRGIRACASILKGTPQVAVFDTAFHQTMPETAFLYGISYRYYTQYAIRRYGFHGTSHRFVSGEAARIMKKPISRLKMITCHLGNGCSMAAVDRGISVDTTMGFTPLEGLIMGTRSGDIDPAVVLFLTKKEKISPMKAVNTILNKESGLLGISAASNDMRDLMKNMKGRGRKARLAKLALDLFIYRIEKYVGAYFAAMRGLDAVVFTAGISEHCPWLVKRISDDMKDVVPKSTKFMVVPTNEELLIAKDTYEIIKGKKGE